jgi:trimeric autotransporter adhesin
MCALISELVFFVESKVESEMKLTIRMMRGLIGALILSIFLAACGGGGSNNTTGSTNSVSSSSAAPGAPGAPTLSLSYQRTKMFHFSWTSSSGATSYKLFENVDGKSGFTQLGSDLTTAVSSSDQVMPLYKRTNAQYRLQACNAVGCTDSNLISVSDTLTGAVGYFKATRADPYLDPQKFGTDNFGQAIAMSEDGTLLVVGVPGEDRDANDQFNAAAAAPANEPTVNSGGVYMFQKNGQSWAEVGHVKGDKGVKDARFGSAVAISADGSTIAVGAPSEPFDPSNASNKLYATGAVYVFVRSGSVWTKQDRFSDSTLTGTGLTGSESNLYGFNFGSTVALSQDGNLLAVGTPWRMVNTMSYAGQINTYQRIKNQSDGKYSWSLLGTLVSPTPAARGYFGNALAIASDGKTLIVGAPASTTPGAVHLFTLDSTFKWINAVTLTSASADNGDHFGSTISLSKDGSVLAVGAPSESSNAQGVGGNQLDNNAKSSGAVYVFTKNNTTWSSPQYLKPSNTVAAAYFGAALAMSADGRTLIVGASGDTHNGQGVNPPNSNTTMDATGAAYVFIKNGSDWMQQAFLKSSNAEKGDNFGVAVAIAGDGSVLASGADLEDSNAIGINGNSADNSIPNAGAVYLY